MLKREEILSSAIHGAGLALSLVGLAVLALLSEVARLIACSIFGATLVMLYAASTIYHGARSPRLKRIFKVLDHSAIYLLIAGTYTPFALINLKGLLGWGLLVLVWALALIGILFGRLLAPRLRLAMYLFMGWMGIVAIKQLAASAPRSSVALLLLGGAFYTVGLLFYGSRKIPCGHAIWHIFVLAGSTSHYFAVLLAAMLN
jgi:hemolysin III